MNGKSRRPFLAALVVATVGVVFAVAEAAPPARPNIVLVIGDDHAWTDYGFMGNPDVRTPHIDRLAAEGLTFTRGYVTTALCSPSLATLLTGLHPHQHSITGNDPVKGQSREAWLERFFRHPLLPRLLADAGYVTMHTGKYWMRKPADVGFTRDMGETDRHGGQALAIGRNTMQPIYDAIDAAGKDSKPFFVWYAPFLPHQPHNPPPRLLEKYASIKPEERAKYYAMIEWLDETMGDLMANLKSRGIDDDTLVVYLNDNGWNEFGKLTPYENGVRTPVVLRWPKRVAARMDREHVAGNIDVMPTLLAAAGVPLPAGLPGVNLLDEKAVAARDTIFLANYTHDMVAPDEPGRSLLSRSCIHGTWKLIEWQDRLPGNGRREGKQRKNPAARQELFDLAADPGETKNLAAGEPDRVRDLTARLDGWWNPVAAAAVDTPNIVVLYADDLGYGDVRCYNPERGKIPTPHIDRLAAQGMRFTDGHSSSGVCSPSRYALLTGRYHWRSRLQAGIVGVYGEALIAPDRVTIGTLAGRHGYRTACIGKWHLGWDWPIPADRASLFRRKQEADGPPSPEQMELWKEVFSQPIPGGPITRGFDVYFGTDVPNWPPYCFIDQDRTVGIPTEFLPARLLKKNQASNPGPALAGWQLEPILPALGDRAVKFIGESAAAKTPFLLYMPLTTPHTPLAVNAEWRGKSGLGNDFADLVMETDAVVGRVLAALDEAGVADKTLVLFTADNGCAPYIGIKELEAKGHFPSGPLRGSKADAWEGGHRVPFIVRWPGVVKPGSTSDALVHQADLIATVAEILGTQLPDDAGEDSFSLLPLLKGITAAVRTHAVSCSIRGVPAVRLGSWKYIAAPGSGGWGSGGDQSQPVQLYDLAADIGETKNLAAVQPDRVVELQALLDKLIADGRSTPGSPQKNDVDVVRHPKPTPQGGLAPPKRGQRDRAPAAAVDAG